MKKEKDVTIPAEHFEVEGEEHEVFMNDEGEVMVANEGPQRIKNALKNYSEEHSREVGDAIEAAMQMEDEWKNVKTTDDPQQKEVLSQKAAKHELRIANILKILHFGKGKDEMEKKVIDFPMLADLRGEQREYDRQLLMQQVEINNLN